MKPVAKEIFSDFCDIVANIVASNDTEEAITEQVADALRMLLKNEKFELEPQDAPPSDETYVMYPLHIAEDGSFSIAAAVWNVGQETPVHGHETWGVVGIASGIERETAYQKPTKPGIPLEPLGTTDWSPGEVTVCCTTDDDVHWVAAYGDEPCVGIHIYGGDIGKIPRRKYDPSTGAVSWFTSEWASTIAH